MMAEIEAGHIGVVIVKDMSRFGRDYLQVGYYTEMFFPERGIRFIAVVNDVDSKKPSSSNDFLPFLNVMNEWYAKDTSRKIKAIFHSRMEKGERCTGSAPYGFMAAKVNGVYQLVIDEEAAKVIRRIFSMAAEGKSTREIADALTADKVLVPSAYDQQTEGRPNYRGAVKEPFHWKTWERLSWANLSGPVSGVRRESPRTKANGWSSQKPTRPLFPPSCGKRQTVCEDIMSTTRPRAPMPTG